MLSKRASTFASKSHSADAGAALATSAIALAAIAARPLRRREPMAWRHDARASDRGEFEDTAAGILLAKRPHARKIRTLAATGPVHSMPDGWDFHNHLKTMSNQRRGRRRIQRGKRFAVYSTGCSIQSAASFVPLRGGGQLRLPARGR
ncbi:MAG TPA: hypothetical protein VMU96_11675 [Casimicrobiaceae bacterium]|nr:hypothetical protein [Casimicrobiaceae bacterium]